jgi:hypothetical protein
MTKRSRPPALLILLAATLFAFIPIAVFAVWVVIIWNLGNPTASVLLILGSGLGVLLIVWETNYLKSRADRTKHRAEGEAKSWRGTQP